MFSGVDLTLDSEENRHFSQKSGTLQTDFPFGKAKMGRVSTDTTRPQSFLIGLFFWVRIMLK